MGQYSLLRLRDLNKELFSEALLPGLTS